MKGFIFLFFIAISINSSAANLSIRCTFPKGVATDFDKGYPNDKKTPKGDLPDLIFDRIDLEKKTARMIGNVADDSIVALRGYDSINFLEQTGAGNIILTTVFYHSKLQSHLTVPVTHSRHNVGLDGKVLVSHYWGSCTRLL